MLVIPSHSSPGTLHRKKNIKGQAESSEIKECWGEENKS